MNRRSFLKRLVTVVAAVVTPFAFVGVSHPKEQGIPKEWVEQLKRDWAVEKRPFFAQKPKGLARFAMEQW